MKQNWITPFLIAPLTIVLVLALQSAVVLLPYPLSAFNVAVFALIFALLIWESGGVVWFAATLYAVMDWYTVTPYGLLLISSTLAMLTVLWCYRSFFTNRSPIAAGALSVLLSTTRLLYYGVGYYVLSFLSNSPGPTLSFLVTALVVEVLITSPIVFIMYLGVRRLVPALRVTHTTSLRNL